MTPANNTKEARQATLDNITKFLQDIDKQGLTGPEVEALKKIAEARQKEITEALKHKGSTKAGQVSELSADVKKQLGIEEPANA